MLPSSSVSCQGGSKVQTMGKKRGETVKRRRVNIQKWSGHASAAGCKPEKKCNLGEALFASNFENPNVVAPKDLQREEILFQKH